MEITYRQLPPYSQTLPPGVIVAEGRGSGYQVDMYVREKLQDRRGRCAYSIPVEFTYVNH